MCTLYYRKNWSQRHTSYTHTHTRTRARAHTHMAHSSEHVFVHLLVCTRVSYKQVSRVASQVLLQAVLEAESYAKGDGSAESLGRAMREGFLNLDANMRSTIPQLGQGYDSSGSTCVVSDAATHTTPALHVLRCVCHTGCAL